MGAWPPSFTDGSSTSRESKRGFMRLRVAHAFVNSANPRLCRRETRVWWVPFLAVGTTDLYINTY